MMNPLDHLKPDTHFPTFYHSTESPMMNPLDHFTPITHFKVIIVCSAEHCQTHNTVAKREVSLGVACVYTARITPIIITLNTRYVLVGLDLFFILTYLPLSIFFSTVMNFSHHTRNTAALSNDSVSKLTLRSNRASK